MENLSNNYSDAFVAYAIEVIKPGLLKLDFLIQQATFPSKEIFSNSPDLEGAILNLILDSLPTHPEMSMKLLDSENMRELLKQYLLGPAQLLESLREKSLDL